MAIDSLIDTGTILAILDAEDPWHQACVDAYYNAQLPLMSSVAVFTEVFHILRRKRIDLEVAWTFLRSGVIILGSIIDEDLPELHLLMSKYSDRPMDFADATLVHLAQRESLTKILTVDHDDFETYRIGGRRRFEILPGWNR